MRSAYPFHRKGYCQCWWCPRDANLPDTDGSMGHCAFSGRCGETLMVMRRAALMGPAQIDHARLGDDTGDGVRPALRSDRFSGLDMPRRQIRSPLPNWRRVGAGCLFPRFRGGRVIRQLAPDPRLLQVAHRALGPGRKAADSAKPGKPSAARQSWTSCETFARVPYPNSATLAA